MSQLSALGACVHRKKSENTDQLSSVWGGDKELLRVNLGED